MQAQNGTPDHFLDAQFDNIRAEVKKLIDRASGKSAVRSKLARITETARDAIIAHPIAAAGLALGIGYAIVRAIRR